MKRVVSLLTAVSLLGACTYDPYSGTYVPAGQAPPYAYGAQPYAAQQPYAGGYAGGAVSSEPVQLAPGSGYAAPGGYAAQTYGYQQPVVVPYPVAPAPYPYYPPAYSVIPPLIGLGIGIGVGSGWGWRGGHGWHGNRGGWHGGGGGGRGWYGGGGRGGRGR